MANEILNLVNPVDQPNGPNSNIPVDWNYGRYLSHVTFAEYVERIRDLDGLRPHSAGSRKYDGFLPKVRRLKGAWFVLKPEITEYSTYPFEKSWINPPPVLAESNPMVSLESGTILNPHALLSDNEYEWYFVDDNRENQKIVNIKIALVPPRNLEALLPYEIALIPPGNKINRFNYGFVRVGDGDGRLFLPRNYDGKDLWISIFLVTDGNIMVSEKGGRWTMARKLGFVPQVEEPDESAPALEADIAGAAHLAN